MPVPALKYRGVLNNKLVGSDANVPEIVVKPSLAFFRTLFPRAVVC